MSIFISLAFITSLRKTFTDSLSVPGFFFPCKGNLIIEAYADSKYQIKLQNYNISSGEITTRRLSMRPTQPNENGRLFPVPKGTVAMGGGLDKLRSQTTPSSQPAVPSPPAT